MTNPHPTRAWTWVGSEGRSFGDWLCVFEDNTEVVVCGSRAGPHPLGVAKAQSIVQGRAYLERRALQLVAPITRSIAVEGGWRLVTIDFGAEARRHQSEFLMCFAFELADISVCSATPYVEVGFRLATGQGGDPLFELTVKAVRGFQDAVPAQGAADHR